MKNLIKTFLFVFTISMFFAEFSFSQTCDTCGCGTKPGINETDNPGTFFGGRYKPNRSDIGGAPAGFDYFPTLIVFVQFQEEQGNYSNDTNAWNPGQAPNYINKVITQTRVAITNWWDNYNGFDISDYWHEFSRGKLHILGQALSIVLSHDTAWYRLNGGHAKLNKDIYDALIALNIDWSFYDKWTYNGEGDFSYSPDQRVDMLYVVYRSWPLFAFQNGVYWGYGNLGPCDGASNNEYTVQHNPDVKIRGDASGKLDPLGSGVILFSRDTSRYNRHRFLDLVTHEHGHYFFGGNHKTYGKMASGLSYTWEFSFSPWEMVKLNYIQQKYVNYSTPIHYLYDYMSRSGTAGTEGEILQIPITSDDREFFLIANRRRVSVWDRRMGGDTLANSRYQSLKNINPEYGKGIYIYHIDNGYDYNKELKPDDHDLECADGLWNWIYSGITRNRIDNQQPENVYIRQNVSYSNDYPQGNHPNYISGKDEISNGISFTKGSPDNFSSNPIARGTHTLYTNENDYWYSLAALGDRWDGWNVGYNEIFSPYSSPNTKAMNNDSTGIFVWYQSLEANTNKATIKIYRAEYGGLSEDSILHLTPPSRPMGIKIENYHSISPLFCYPKVVWNHNNEPDMLRTGNVKQYKIYKATQPRMSDVPTAYSLFATQNIHKDSIAYFVDLSVNKYDCSLTGPPPYGTQYPVRYYVKAVDKYDDESVPSDFASTVGVTNGGIDPIGPDNFISINPEIPKEFSLKQNYPNPFNPNTNIQYDLPSDNFVTIKIYDILGKEVKTLVNEFKNAGSYIISFNATNLSSGIYYYKIVAGNFEQIRKMILLK